MQHHHECLRDFSERLMTPITYLIRVWAYLVLGYLQIYDVLLVFEVLSAF